MAKRKTKLVVLYVRVPEKLHTQVWERSCKNNRSMSKESIELIKQALTIKNHS